MSKQPLCLYVLGLSVFLLLFTGQQDTYALQNKTIGLLKAVQQTLAHQASLELGRLDLRYAQGVRQETSGQFDTRIQAGVEHGQDRTPLIQDSENRIRSTYKLGLSRQLRSGLVLNPELKTTRNEYKYSDQDPNSQTGAYLKLTLPLLKGFGTLATAGRERAATQDVLSARFDLKHFISQAVLDAVLAYWQYLLDFKRLQQLRKAENRAHELMTQTKDLVQGHERPASDLDEVKANLADKRTQTIAAEQSLMQSGQALGLAMGIPFSRMQSLLRPEDGFEMIQTEKNTLKNLDESALLDYALKKRSDIQAMKTEQESASIREQVQENNLLPSLDLGMQAGYQSMERDSTYVDMFKAPFADVPGASWQLSLTYEFPVQNRKALGQRNQQRIQRRKLQVKTKELARTIQSNVHTTLALLRRNRLELVNARQTVKLYKKAVQNQQMKYKMGMGTQLDLIKTQDNLTQARLNELSALLKYSQSLSKLRFQTSSLVFFKDEQARIDINNLVSLPEPEKLKEY